MTRRARFKHRDQQRLQRFADLDPRWLALPLATLANEQAWPPCCQPRRDRRRLPGGRWETRLAHAADCEQRPEAAG